MNEQILQKVIEIFAEAAEEENIQPGDNLIEDLELNSVEVLTLLADLEDAFDLEIPESYVQQMGTIQDVADIIVSLKNK